MNSRALKDVVLEPDVEMVFFDVTALFTKVLKLSRKISPSSGNICPKIILLKTEHRFQWIISQNC